MNELLIHLPLYIGLPLFMILVALLAAGIYLLSRKFIEPHLKKEHERVGRVLFRTSASLLALILSLTFANQRVDYIKIQNSLEAEAAQIVDIVMDLKMYKSLEATKIQEEMKSYILYTLEDGWESILIDPFNSRPVVQYSKIYESIHYLEPVNPMQIALKESMLADIDEVSDFLQVRLYSAQKDPLNLIYTTLFGILAVMILFSVYAPNKLNLLFVSVYNVFLGLVLYFVLMMGNPLRGPLQIKPIPFELLKYTIELNESRNQ